MASSSNNMASSSNNIASSSNNMASSSNNMPSSSDNMASSSSINSSSSSKTSEFTTFFNLLGPKYFSEMKLVKEKLKQMKISSKSKKSEKCSPKKLKYCEAIVNTKDEVKTTLKIPRSSIPILWKDVCPKTSCCIRITNISRNVTINNLHQLFSKFGAIKSLDLHFNWFEKISKGFSYIMFSTPEESKTAAKAMNKCEIDGIKIICELWFLPYIKNRVSSILRNACSSDGEVGYRSSTRSPRKFRLRSRSNSSRTLDDLCSKSSRSRPSKISRSKRSRKPY